MDDNESGLDQVDRKSGPQKNIIGLNLTPEPGSGAKFHPRVPVWVSNSTRLYFFTGRVWVLGSSARRFL
jgi:hypothetical protein